MSLSALYHQDQKTHHTKHFYERCCRHFFSKELLETHFAWCVRGKLQVEEMPKEKKFTYQVAGHELSPLRVVFSDIECYIDPTNKTHFPAAVACREVWHPYHQQRNDSSEMMLWTGDQCIIQYLSKLEEMVKEQHTSLEHLSRRMMDMSESDRQRFESAQTCAICHTRFGRAVHQ